MKRLLYCGQAENAYEIDIPDYIHTCTYMYKANKPAKANNILLYKMTNPRIIMHECYKIFKSTQHNPHTFTYTYIMGRRLTAQQISLSNIEIIIS